MNRENITSLLYQEDEKGNDILCNADGSRFTGVVIESLPSGFITTEYEVKDGLKDGAEKEFYADGSIEHIIHYRYGLYHGDIIYYYSSGLPREKSVFEYGILVEEFEWSESGELVNHQALDAANPKFKKLMHLRENYKW